MLQIKKLIIVRKEKNYTHKTAQHKTILQDMNYDLKKATNDSRNVLSQCVIFPWIIYDIAPSVPGFLPLKIFWSIALIIFASSYCKL